MLAAFLPIFVAYTKITLVYNFVAPLSAEAYSEPSRTFTMEIICENN